MKTIICLALCMLAVSALSPIDTLSSALDVLDLQSLFDDCKAFDLSASFTYLGGESSDDDSISEQVVVQGTYNLLTYEDGKGKLKSGSFNKTKNFDAEGVVNFTGSGSFNARGGGEDSDWNGYFNGGSSTDFAVETDGGNAFGVREHQFSGQFNAKKNWGFGNIEVNVWQDVNRSSNNVEYSFGGDHDEGRYSGTSKISGDTTTADSKEYRSFVNSVFHGVNTKESWQLSGGYVLDVYDSNWDNVYSKDGSFQQNGTSADDIFGSIRGLRSFALPSTSISE